jgi:hypothetical protein
MRNRTATRLAALTAIVLASAASLVGLGTAPVALASGCGYGDYTATSSNIVGNSLQTGLGFSNMLVFVTPNWDPYSVYDDHATGVWWDGTQWDIFNEDGAAMLNHASFHETYTFATSSPSTDVFVQTASAANISGDSTVINDALSNNNPNAVVIVTQNWNPNGVGGTYNNRRIGVYYTGSRWAIFNQDLAAMPLGASFNVMVFPGATGTGDNGVSVQTASSGTISGNTMLLNAGPSAKTVLIVTPNWNPAGHSGVYLNHNIGVYLHSTPVRASIFTQDISSMPTSASFNVFAHPRCDL